MVREQQSKSQFAKMQLKWRGYNFSYDKEQRFKEKWEQILKMVQVSSFMLRILP